MKTGAVKYRPRYGHIMVMFGLFLSIITVTLQSVNAPKTIAFGTSEVASSSNQYRIGAGLPALTLNSKLIASAQAKADDMAANSYFAHDSPGGLSPWYFFDAVGYSYTTAGENLALTNQSAASVTKGWYDSPGHRANMLSGSFTEVGYGIAFVPSFTYNGSTYSNVYLVAAHYALPQVAAVAPTATPPPATPPATVSQPVVATPEPVSEPPASVSQPEEIEQPQQASDIDQPAVSGSTDEENGTTTSGTLAVATQNQPKLPIRLAYVGLGTGALFVIIGSAIEIRRFIHHLPLIPKLHS